MKWKTTLALLVLAIGLGAYVSLYDLKQPTSEQQERLSKEILRFPSDSVTQVVIELPQTNATLIREGAVWRLVLRQAQDSPQKARADTIVIERILRNLDPLEAEHRLPATADRPLDPKTFGLNPPVGRITLIAQDTPTTLLIGEATPVSPNRYLQVSGRPDIFVISPQLFSDANQPVEAFRDRQLIRPDPSAAEGITLTSPTTSFTLAHHGDWTLTHPMQDRADQAAVSKVVSNLRKIAIKRFVNDALPVEPLATWGLDHPRAEVNLSYLGNAAPSTALRAASRASLDSHSLARDSAERSRGTQSRDAATSITLVFGATLPDDQTLVYAKRSDEPSLYAVAAADVDALLAITAESLRARAPESTDGHAARAAPP